MCVGRLMHLYSAFVCACARAVKVHVFTSVPKTPTAVQPELQPEVCAYRLLKGPLIPNTTT